MTVAGWIEILLFVAVLTALTPVVGGYMARVFRGEVTALGFVERPLYRLLGVDPARGQDWKGYARSVLIFSALFGVLLYIDPAHAGPCTRGTRATWARARGTCRSTRRPRSSPTRTGSSTAGRRRCRTSRRWPAWPSRTSSPRASASPCSSPSSARSPRAPARRSASSTSTSAARSSTSCSRCPRSSASCSSRRASSRRWTGRSTRPASTGVDARPSPSGRSPARRRSRCSAPTAAASSTSTRRCRTRTRRGSRTSSRCSRS